MCVSFEGEGDVIWWGGVDVFVGRSVGVGLG